MKIDSFLNPKSIAIIGASNDRKKIGAQVLDNLQRGGFKGKIYPVNLKEKKIAGLKAFGSVNELKNKVDLAVIVIPAPLVAAEVKKCAGAGIKNIVIISAGFAETGGEGAGREEEIKTLAARHKLNILGPNCLGLMNASARLNLTFARAENRGGGVAMLTQSGAIGSAVLDWAGEKNFGFSKFVSLGNKAVLDENDFFDQLAADRETKLVVAYLEEIKDGRRFMEKVSRLAKIKPIAVLKAGSTDAGARAALSHTGSLAGSHEAVLAGLKRSGAIILESLEEVFDLMALAQKGIWPGSGGLYIISNAGGPVVLLSDQAGRLGLEFGDFSAGTAKQLAAKLPPAVRVANPLDIIGDADAVRYEAAIDTVLKDDKVGSLLVILTPQSSTEAEKTADMIVRLSTKHKKKLICASFLGGRAVDRAAEILKKGAVANFAFPEQAIGILSKIAAYQSAVKKLKPYRQPKRKLTAEKKNRQLDYLAALGLLKKYKIPVIRTDRIKRSADLKNLAYPIALKVVGPGINHKTDQGAIKLDLNNEVEAAKAFKNFSRLLRGKKNYCLAQPMGKGIEMILGFKRDAAFGPVIMVGLGGIYAEIFKDVALAAGGLDRAAAGELPKNLQSYKILAGARGRKFDLASLTGAILGVARLADEHPEIFELDINPLFLKEKGAQAADVRIII